MRYGIKFAIYLKKNVIVNQCMVTNFYGNKIPRENEYYTCLSVIVLDYC